jgi:hypothetical protein
VNVNIRSCTQIKDIQTTLWSIFHIYFAITIKLSLAHMLIPYTKFQLRAHGGFDRSAEHNYPHRALLVGINMWALLTPLCLT